MSKVIKTIADVEAALAALGGKMKIAIELGIPKSSLSGFLNGRQRLAEDHVLKLAERLKTRPEVLRGFQPEIPLRYSMAPAEPSLMEDTMEEPAWARGFSDQEIVEFIHRALSDVNLPLDERLRRIEEHLTTLRVRAKREQVANSIQDVEDAAVSIPDAEQAGKPQVSRPKSGADVPSARKQMPSGAASRESTMRPGVPEKAPK